MTYDTAVRHLWGLLGPMGLHYGIYGELEVLDGCLWGNRFSSMGLRSQTYGEVTGANRCGPIRKWCYKSLANRNEDQ